MVLYLVGENLDKTRSHYRAETGKKSLFGRGPETPTHDLFGLLGARKVAISLKVRMVLVRSERSLTCRRAKSRRSR